MNSTFSVIKIMHSAARGPQESDDISHSETVTNPGFESCLINMLLSLWCCNIVPNVNRDGNNETNQQDGVIRHI